jgi:hypothetical protein
VASYFINENYPVYYSSPERQTGILDVYLRVVKPNGSAIGPFLMSELPGINEKGIYKYDFVPDIEGEYLFSVTVPSMNFKDKAIKSATFSLRQVLDSLLDRFTGAGV